MEIILGLVVVAVIAYFVFFRKAAETVVEAAPYKVETVEAQSTVVEQARQVVAEEAAPAKKPRATKAPAAKKVAAKKAPAKKPATKVVKAK